MLLLIVKALSHRSLNSSNRFGVIIALRANQEIPAGEEFFIDYNYNFDWGPRWFKDLFLKYMDDHPEDKNTIERIATGRSREVLDSAYEDYLKKMVNPDQDM